MNKVQNILRRGLQATVPIILTITIIVWMISSIEAFFGFLIKLVVPPENYYKGMGAIFGFLLVFIVGILMNAWVVNKVYDWSESWVKKIPLVKTIYQATQDVMAFFNKSKDETHGQTVLVDTPLGKVLGFITRSDLQSLHFPLAEDIAVYIPLSYQIGGITLLMSRTNVKPIDLPAQEAMRFILTAGMSKDAH